MRCDLSVADGKLADFLNEVKRQGLILQEPSRLLPEGAWSNKINEKPWNILE